MGRKKIEILAIIAIIVVAITLTFGLVSVSGFSKSIELNLQVETTLGSDVYVEIRNLNQDIVCPFRNGIYEINVPEMRGGGTYLFLIPLSVKDPYDYKVIEIRSSLLGIINLSVNDILSLEDISFDNNTPVFYLTEETFRSFL